MSFCTAWANSKLRNCISCRRNDLFYHTGKNVWNLFFIKKFHVLTAWAHLFSTLPQACGKFELVMEALCLHWKLRALFQRFSFFGQKRSGSIFSKLISMWSQVAGCLRQQSGCWCSCFLLTSCCRLCHQRNISVATCSIRPAPTPPHLQRSIMLVCKRNVT